ncbi:MAG: RNA methyltransferase [Flavobacteriales bacterium]|nr:RNA methyltransferase [Flavobacteriales bacterium]
MVTEERKEQFQRILHMRTRQITVVLEDLYQPHNASAVLRSCDCFGIQDVHVIENKNEFELTKGIALGSGKWLSVHRHNEGTNNTPACLNLLKEQGYRIVATTPHKDDQDIHEIDFSQPVALVFGTEKAGISEQVHHLADAYARIPMYGFTESFNISVAAALCLYESRRQLDIQKINFGLSAEEKSELYGQWLKKSIRASERIIAKWYERNDKSS